MPSEQEKQDRLLGALMVIASRICERGGNDVHCKCSVCLASKTIKSINSEV